jgi:hypothetical protein
MSIIYKKEEIKDVHIHKVYVNLNVLSILKLPADIYKYGTIW